MRNSSGGIPSPRNDELSPFCAGVLRAESHAYAAPGPERTDRWFCLRKIRLDSSLTCFFRDSLG